MTAKFSATDIRALEAVLSGARFGTYLREAEGDRTIAAQLYLWNCAVSAEFYILLQYTELALRNAAVEAIEKEFGPNWHLNKGFVRSLPRHKKGYQPRDDLESTAQRLPTAGKVVAELKFAFWKNVYVVGQDRRLWIPHLRTVLPGSDGAWSVSRVREEIHKDLEVVRRLRNRVAHHEPIFGRALQKDFDLLAKLIGYRSPTVARMVLDSCRVPDLLASKPSA